MFNVYCVLVSTEKKKFFTKHSSLKLNCFLQVRKYFNIPAKRNISPAQQMLLMKQQQEVMQSAFKKVKRHQEAMKKFSDEQKMSRK